MIILTLSHYYNSILFLESPKKIQFHSKRNFIPAKCTSSEITKLSTCSHSYPVDSSNNSLYDEWSTIYLMNYSTFPTNGLEAIIMIGLINLM